MNYPTRTRKQIYGFSLIELLVVIAILGILSTLAIPNLVRAHYKGRAIRVITDLKAIREATLNYYTDKGKLPESSGFGQLPKDLQSYLPPGTSAEIKSWKVQYVYCNYSRWINYGSKAWQNWLRNGGFVVGIIVLIRNPMLANMVYDQAPNMFGLKYIFPKYGGYLYFSIE